MSSALSFAASFAASLCPSCPVGEAARQQVFDQGFETNFLVTAAPFLLVGVVSRWAARSFR